MWRSAICSLFYFYTFIFFMCEGNFFPFTLIYIYICIYIYIIFVLRRYMKRGNSVCVIYIFIFKSNNCCANTDGPPESHRLSQLRSGHQYTHHYCNQYGAHNETKPTKKNIYIFIFNQPLLVTPNCR